MRFPKRGGIVALLIFAGATYLFAWSPVFTAKTIVVTGVPQGVTDQFFINKSQFAIGEKLARIEPRSVEEKLEEISWVKSASVSRNWMRGQVKISIATRTPIGIYKGRALDASGALFDIPVNLPTGLPTVTASTPELGLLAISVFTNLPKSLRDSLQSMSAPSESAISSWQRVSDRNIKVTWGRATEIDFKVSVFQALLALPENAKIKRVDLSAPHAPIVK